jgi:hypothetical protein
MSTHLSYRFNNPALQQQKKVSDTLAADTDLLAWISADVDHVVASGSRIVSFNDRVGRGSSFVATAENRRALLIDDAINGYSAARFDTDGVPDWDDYLSSALALATDSPATIAAIVRLDTLGKDHEICGRFASTTSRLTLTIGANNLPRLFAKNRFVASPLAMASAQWALLISATDGAATSKIWHMGVTTIDTLGTAGDTGTGPLRIGSLSGTQNYGLDADVADIWVFKRDILADEDDASAAALKQYATQLYELNIGA